jgi:hypothetical protein
MNEITKAQELFTRTLGLWAEANQHVAKSLVDFAGAAGQEGVRLYGDLQRCALDAVRDAQAAAIRWQDIAIRATAGAPSGWWEKSVVEVVNGSERAFRLAEEQVQAVTRAAERLQATAEQAGKGIQEALAGTAAKLKDLYATA